MMDLFEYAEELDFGEIHLRVNPKTGLRAIVALHNLQLGPAIGGCRFLEYDSSDDALRDAMRLGRGMTYKAAITRLAHGGGKSVLIRPKGLTPEQRTAIFEEFGDFVDSLGGRYITAEDSGTSVADMNLIATRTKHVLGTEANESSSGDPSPVTARGVLHGIEAAVKYKYGRDDLAGLRIALQGVGNVGYYLAESLHELGAELIVSDINQDALDRCAKEFGATVVEPDAIYSVESDIFAPCALGASINDDTLPKLTCDIVAGSANNQLAEDRHGAELRERGILYAPDYVINAGGLIQVAADYAGEDSDWARTKTEGIFDSLMEIFERADREELPTANVTDRIVEEMLGLK
jgi:leucine dehydrogenase